MHEKIVITGMGTINPIGHSVDESWNNALAGVSGVGPITRFDSSGLPVELACEIKNYDATHFMSAKEARRRDLFEQFAIIAAAEALGQSGLEITDENAHRVGVIVAAAIGGINSLQDAILTLRDQGARKISPFAIPMLMPNGGAGLIAIEFGAKGPSSSVVSACASGSDSIGTSWLMLRSGMIDVAITGASEAPITGVAIGAFDRLGALSRTVNGGTPRPFDLNRDGLVIGEGAGILILERESHARKRGAEILAELAGYGATADAYHVTAPAAGGAGGAAAIRLALEAASIAPEEIDYINTHGTATTLNDVAETNALKTVFGDLAYNIPASSTKSMTGHMMGATGAVEAIFCAQALIENVLPPTINYSTPDPECDLDYVPNTPREKNVRAVLSNAFGFGGHNAVLVIRKY